MLSALRLFLKRTKKKSGGVCPVSMCVINKFTLFQAESERASIPEQWVNKTVTEIPTKLEWAEIMLEYFSLWKHCLLNYFFQQVLQSYYHLLNLPSCCGSACQIHFEWLSPSEGWLAWQLFDYVIHKSTVPSCRARARICCFSKIMTWNICFLSQVNIIDIRL